jgi:DNA-binding transcriptional regulator YiaG
MNELRTVDFHVATTHMKRRRPRTSRTGQAERVAAQLRKYFRSATQLATALGTSRDTLRAWSTGNGPARPRVELLEVAELLLKLCVAARRYVANDHQVGDWAVAPDPRLHGASPSEALRRYGREGLEVLLADLVVVAPPRPTGPIELPSLEALRAALAAGIGAEAAERIQRIASAEPIVLTDEELEAELHAVTQDEAPADSDRVIPGRS